MTFWDWVNAQPDYALLYLIIVCITIVVVSNRIFRYKPRPMIELKGERDSLPKGQ